MGLDMYLMGEAKQGEVDLGYWRKHPNLHGYIVQNYGPIATGGEKDTWGQVYNPGQRIDDCKPIPLTREDLLSIACAVREGRLPHTSGFFFGCSYGNELEKDEDLGILTTAINFLKQDPGHSVYYRASW